MSKKKLLRDKIDESLGIRKKKVVKDGPIFISIGKIPKEYLDIFENGQIN